jgi:hypothetical protein
MLRNPKVVIALGILACLLLFRNVFLAFVPHLSFSLARKTPVPAAAPERTPGANGTAKPAPLDTAAPELGIDLAQLDWAKFRPPRRDPFASVARTNAPAASTAEAGSAQSNASAKAREVLELKAVWLQESGRLAVINDQIVGEGESVLGFRIEKIQADGVVVQGPQSRESVEFSQRSQSAGGTSNAPGKPAPAPAPAKAAGR